MRDVRRKGMRGIRNLGMGGRRVKCVRLLRMVVINMERGGESRRRRGMRRRMEK